MLGAFWRRLALRRTWPVPVAALVLSLLGLVSIAAVDGPDAARRQGQFLVLALGAMAFFQVVHYRVLLSLAWPLYGIGLALVAYTVLDKAVNVPLVQPIKGARNWISLPGFSVQPAEVVKVGFVMVLARHLRFTEEHRTLRGLLLAGGLMAGPVALILLQPDLGTALVFLPTTAAVLYVAGARVRHFGLVVGVVAAVLPLLWLSGTDAPVLRHLPSVVKTYQRDRVAAMFRDDEQTLQGTGFQQQWALAAAGTGGVAGKGLGEAPAGRRVPEAQNDMIFAVVGEQFGFRGSLAVIACYAAIAVTGARVALRCKDPFGQLAAVGVVTLITGQAFLNLAVALKLMPVTGVTLPYVSAGGSSLIASYIGAGLLMNIGQYRPYTLARRSFAFED